MVKQMLHKCEDLGFNPETPHENAGHGRMSWQYHTEEAETGQRLGVAGQQAEPNWQALGQ